MGLVRCGKACWGNKTCKRKRDCDCRGGELKSINPNLYEGFSVACNSDNPPISVDDYLKNYVGGEVMYNNYGLIVGGYNPHSSAQYQAYIEQETKEAEKTASTSKIVRVITIGLIGGIVLGLLWLFLPSKQ